MTLGPALQPAQAGNVQRHPDLEQQPLFLLVNCQLDAFAREFQRIPQKPEFSLDDATVDQMPFATFTDLNRLRVGLLLFHFCAFHRRIIVPLQRCDLEPERCFFVSPCAVFSSLACSFALGQAVRVWHHYRMPNVCSMTSPLLLPRAQGSHM